MSKRNHDVVRFDDETKKWFESHIGTQSTIACCKKCGLWYKPTLGHKCKKEKKEKK